MTDRRPDQKFSAESAALEDAYLLGVDEIARSGFGAGAARWEAERRPLTEGINRDGSFLDVGCANGLLARCVVEWVAERGVELIPFGVDLGAQLVAEAQQMFPADAANFVVADAWTWAPTGRFTFVYSLLDLAPDHLIVSWINRLASWVEPGGRLILGSYGSKSRSIEPVDVASVLRDAGWVPAGESVGGSGPITRFAWTERDPG